MLHTAREGRVELVEGQVRDAQLSTQDTQDQQAAANLELKSQNGSIRHQLAALEA